MGEWHPLERRPRWARIGRRAASGRRPRCRLPPCRSHRSPMLGPGCSPCTNEGPVASDLRPSGLRRDLSLTHAVLPCRSTWSPFWVPSLTNRHGWWAVPWAGDWPSRLHLSPPTGGGPRADRSRSRRRPRLRIGSGNVPFRSSARRGDRDETSTRSTGWRHGCG